MKYKNEPSYIERLYNIKHYAKYDEGTLRIKFCHRCWSENKEIYLNREHQVQNNYICYKHKTVLQYVEFNKKKAYSLKINVDELTVNSPFCIEKGDKLIELYLKISEFIHEIFSLKETGTDIEIKSKLRNKMKSLGYMHKVHNYILNMRIFEKEFHSYNIMKIGDKELLGVLFSTERKVNPISYLTMIIFLFATIDDFFDYMIKDEKVETIMYYKHSVSLLTKPKKGYRSIDDYNNILKKSFRRI